METYEASDYLVVVRRGRDAGQVAVIIIGDKDFDQNRIVQKPIRYKQKICEELFRYSIVCAGTASEAVNICRTGRTWVASAGAL